jgi:uncharacterized membrane protein YphA (DoxX/SURF4 family)
MHAIEKKLDFVTEHATASKIRIKTVRPVIEGFALMLTPKALWLRGESGDRSAWVVLGIRIFVAAVWFVFGTIFKVLDLVPRHREIVAAILGNEIAPAITTLIGLAETGIGLWMLSGFLPRSCAATQTIAIVSMNALELIYAHSFLLAPLPMVATNSVLLALVWYAALWPSAKQS